MLRLAAALAIVAIPASVGATTLKVDYLITLGGLTLGQADLNGAFEDQRYEVRMKAQLTGIAGLFTSSGRGSATATGTIQGSRLSPAGFAATGKTGSAERVVRMAIASGTAGHVEIEPPFEPRPDRIPLGDADRRGIVDPLTAMIGVAAQRGKADDPANCNRTIPVFDGTQRFDVVLSYAETKPVQKPGFSGTVLVCNARYVPIAGHRPLRWAVQYMKDNREMSVWLAPVEGTRILVPIRVSIMTYFGTSVVEATRWSLDGEGAPAMR